MRSSRQIKNQNTVQGNVLAKSNKLTIEVNDDEDAICLQKIGKNSPKFAKPSSENQKKYPFVKPTIPKTPASASSSRKPLKECNTPVAKFINFSSTPKSIKRTASKPVRLVSKRNSSKEPSSSKSSLTPTQRKSSNESKRRPKTTTNEKETMKPDTNSLNSLVTQVKMQPKKFDLDLPDLEKNQNSELIYKEHLFQTFQALKFVSTLPPVNLDQLKEKRVNVSRRKGYENKKTLVFDLDETLVHCCDEATEGKGMITLPIIFPTGELVQAGINIRPYAIECLKEVGKYFEVFVFTASHPCYANVVLDYLDPKRELIHQRFFRDSCINTNGVFIKDLRIFANRNLKDLIIVDNAAYSFGYQITNGIPIISWHNDPYDKELYNLVDYVKVLASADDIREINDRTFHLKTFYDDYADEFMKSEIKSPRGVRRS